MTDPISVKLSAAIHKDIKNIDDHRLPSIRSMATHYHTSVTSIQAALRILSQKGIVTIQHGKRAEICKQVDSRKSQQSLKDLKPDMVELIVNKIRANLLSGTYRAFEKLPKIHFISSQYGVSHHTVSHALQKLENQGLICRQGNQYFSGNLSRVDINRDTLSPSMILICSWDLFTWNRMTYSPMTKPFCEAFAQEANRQGIRLNELVFESKKESFTEFTERLHQFLHSLEKKPVGILLLGDIQYLGDSTIHLQMMDICKELNISVTWLDRNNLADPKKQRYKNQFRCHSSEAANVKVCLERLYTSGHRRVTYLLFDVKKEENRWQVTRGALIKKNALNFPEPMDIHFLQIDRSKFKKSPTLSELSRSLKQFRSSNPQCTKHIEDMVDKVMQARTVILKDYQYLVPLSQSQDQLAPLYVLLQFMNSKERQTKFFQTHIIVAEQIWYWLNLYEILEEHRTAVICPNDNLCNWYFLTSCQTMKIKIPEQLSVISFDNSLTTNLNGLTSVDPAFAYLGYQAFHSLLGAVSINRDRYGNIAAKPFVVDRGKVARVSVTHS